MARIFPIGGGKGGVGKSFIAANLGVIFAKQGKKVVLVDLDLGGSNLHTFLGVKEPKTGLNDFLNRSLKDLKHAALPTIIPNLYIICSMYCSLEIANLFHAQKLKIIKAIQRLPFDYIVLDLAAGTHFNTLDFCLSSDEALFVLTPEPTSIENTLRFIKAVYYRRMKQILKQHAFSMIIKKIVDRSRDGVPKISDIMDLLIERDPASAKLLRAKLGEYRFSFVLNECRKQVGPNLGNNIEKVCNRYFYSKFQFLGNINYDERIYNSVFSRKIYIVKYPYTQAATDLQEIARKLMEVDQNRFQYHRNYHEMA